LDIHVCSLSRLPEVAAALRPARLITLMSRSGQVVRPAVIAPEDHLVMEVGDISVATDGHVLPCETHIEELFAFAKGWRREAPLLIHCYAGISRSTAAAYSIACALAPERDEDELARTLRKASPSATPNPLIVELADRTLGREGRMVEAVRRIGRGADAFEGAPFRLSLTV
jgi:predicted protein tyrosine phosphatase